MTSPRSWTGRSVEHHPGTSHPDDARWFGGPIAYGWSPPVENVGLEPTASCLQGRRSSYDELVPRAVSFQT